MDKIALITGGASGLGWELVQYFRTKMKVVALDQKVQNSSENVVFFPCDVCDPKSVKRAKEQIARDFGKIDLVVHNAGLFVEKNWEETSWEDWQTILSTNLSSAFLVSKVFLDHCTEKACIIHISSGLGTIAEPNAMSYSVAKAGLNMLTKCLSLSLAPRRVVGIAPGPIQLGEGEKCPLKEKYEYRLFNPLQRFATAQEVVSLVDFVYKNGYVNGTTLAIDGGESAVGSAWSIGKKWVDEGGIS